IHRIDELPIHGKMQEHVAELFPPVGPGNEHISAQGDWKLPEVTTGGRVTAQQRSGGVEDREAGKIRVLNDQVIPAYTGKHAAVFARPLAVTADGPDEVSIRIDQLDELGRALDHLKPSLGI